MNANTKAVRHIATRIHPMAPSPVTAVVQAYLPYLSSSDTDEQSGDDGCVKRYIARGTYLALLEPTRRANDLIA
jgi:hypothetical protein